MPPRFFCKGASPDQRRPRSAIATANKVEKHLHGNAEVRDTQRSCLQWYQLILSQNHRTFTGDISGMGHAYKYEDFGKV